MRTSTIEKHHNNSSASLTSWYRAQTVNQTLTFDSAQLGLIQQLDKFIQQISRKQNIVSWVINKFKPPKKLGYYIYGSVGSGKTMLMDQLYHLLPTDKKTRQHFHQFMSNIHQELANLQAHDEPLRIIAQQMKKRYNIIVLDEMHVSDIATAMILKNLFMSLFAEGIYIITSSNFAPNQLYLDGLMRERFLPAISLIQHRLEVVALNTSQDYRFLHQTNSQLFFINSQTNQPLEQVFNQINHNQHYLSNASILVQSRQIPFIRQAQDIIWFDFKVLCGDRRSQLDYLELSKQFSWFILDGIYALQEKDKDMARRFTWLIDILYDNKNKLALTSTVDINHIYPKGDYSNEFSRTVSRLQEMQTTEYLAH